MNPAARTSFSNRRVVLITLLCLAGVSLALYSVAETYRIRDVGPGGQSLCSISTLFDCHAAHASTHGFVFGVPLGWFALLYFAWAILVLLWGLFRPAARDAACGAVFLSSLVASAFALWKTAVLVFVIRVLCPVCILMDAVIIAVLVTSLKTPGPSLRLAGRWLREATRRAAAWSARIAWGRQVWIYLLVLGVILGLGTWTILTQGRAISRDDILVMQEVVRFYREPVIELEVPANAPSWGRPDAPVHIVEFSDFTCPFCRLATEQFHELLRGREDVVRIDFLHYPLDREVNPRVRGRGHRQAGQAARAAVLAHEMGVFWEYHDTLFAHEDRIDKTFLQDWFLRLGIGTDRLEEALEGKDTEAVIRRHVEFAGSLDVEGVPTIFINGRRLRRYFRPVLESILRQELRDAGVEIEAGARMFERDD